MTKRILILDDGSDFSRQIFGCVAKLLSPKDNDLILLRVAPSPGGMIPSPARPLSSELPLPMYESRRDVEYAFHPIYASQESDSQIAAIRDGLEEDAQTLRRAGYAVSVEIRMGDAAQEIVRFIENERIDAIAMPTHGRSGLSRIIFGSVANEILRSVAVPILLLRPTDPDFA